MSSKDPVESAAKGVAAAVIEWSEDKVKALARKFRDRKLAFVQNPEIIKLAKELRLTSEWEFFQLYVDDPRLHILFQMGLILRQLERNEKQREDLRGRILRKYGPEGLHIAQFIQNGFFPKYVSNILERVTSPVELKSEVMDLFRNIEVTNSYIQIYDNVEKEAATIVARIRSNSPRTYIIGGTRSAGIKCKKVKNLVMQQISGYRDELYRTEIKEIYFLNKVDG